MGMVMFDRTMRMFNISSTVAWIRFPYILFPSRFSSGMLRSGKDKINIRTGSTYILVP